MTCIEGSSRVFIYPGCLVCRDPGRGAAASKMRHLMSVSAWKCASPLIGYSQVCRAPDPSCPYSRSIVCRCGGALRRRRAAVTGEPITPRPWRRDGGGSGGWCGLVSVVVSVFLSELPAVMKSGLLACRIAQHLPVGRRGIPAFSA